MPRAAMISCLSVRQQRILVISQGLVYHSHQQVHIAFNVRKRLQRLQLFKSILQHDEGQDEINTYCRL